MCNREYTLHNWLTACQVRDTSIFDRALPPGLAYAPPPASRMQFRFCDPFPRGDFSREGAKVYSSAREAENSMAKRQRRAQHFTVVIERDEDGQYVASVPLL